MKARTLGQQAIAASAGLSALFLLVYGSCNWITAHRPHVGSYYFEWERAIPFVPILIPAYLSLDLFFIGAPFLCKTSGELFSYSKRIAAAILIGGICFLLFPLRFAFERPHADGILGMLFDGFRAVDAPYNLFPSLHAALLLLVADVYVRHLSGLTRIAIMLWFILIGLSPVLAYQHHVIDIIGGIVLAIGCFYFLPERGRRSAVVPNYRIGAYYLIGAALLLLAILMLRNWLAVLLVWPMAALGIVATSYLGLGPQVYRKANGRLAWSARLVLAPWLLGQCVSRYYYRRRCQPWDRVTSRVWIGSQLTVPEVKTALRAGVSAVLDLTAEFSERNRFRDICYRNIQVLDLTAPTQDQLVEMAKFITTERKTGTVYVHCKIGYSRSAAAIAAYLLYSGEVECAAEAFAMIRRARPSIIIRSEVVSALEQFELELPSITNQTFVLASADQALA